MAMIHQEKRKHFLLKHFFQTIANDGTNECINMYRYIDILFE